jgi:predicted nucleic acid-binding protein
VCLFATAISRPPGRYSFCDAFSFVIAERLGIRNAIAFDRHFSAWGRLIILA